MVDIIYDKFKLQTSEVSLQFNNKFIIIYSYNIFKFKIEHFIK